MYNLARIYYFGIETKRKISKAIALLEQASNKQLFIAVLFLLYIFSNCDDKNFLCQTKFQEYQNKCKNNIQMQLLFIDFNDYHSIQNIHVFLRDYDLLKGYDYSFDLFYFLLNDKFYDWKTQNDNNQSNDKSLKKDINTNFYEGFYD